MNSTNLHVFRLDELRTLCENRCLGTNGNKSELKQKLIDNSNDDIDGQEPNLEELSKNDLFLEGKLLGMSINLLKNKSKRCMIEAIEEFKAEKENKMDVDDNNNSNIKLKSNNNYNSINMDDNDNDDIEMVDKTKKRNNNNNNKKSKSSRINNRNHKTKSDSYNKEIEELIENVDFSLQSFMGYLTPFEAYNISNLSQNDILKLEFLRQEFNNETKKSLQNRKLGGKGNAHKIKESQNSFIRPKLSETYVEQLQNLSNNLNDLQNQLEFITSNKNNDKKNKNKKKNKNFNNAVGNNSNNNNTIINNNTNNNNNEISVTIGINLFKSEEEYEQLTETGKLGLISGIWDSKDRARKQISDIKALKKRNVKLSNFPINKILLDTFPYNLSN